MRQLRRRTSWTAAVALTVSALLLAGCGSGGSDDDGNEGADGSGSGTTTVTVGMLPILPTAALYAGIDAGYFADEGLELEIQTGQGGAALLPGVVSGQIDVATSNPVSLLQAREQGLDVRVIAHWTSSRTSGDDANAVVVGGDSPIRTPKDLEGRTVAVNTLQGMGGLTIREAVRADGGDPDAVRFVELGFPDMPAALAQGNVDAAWFPEPFVTIVLGDGGRVVTYPGPSSVPGHPTQLFFVSGQRAEQEPELVERITRALNRTSELAEQDPAAVIAAVPQVLDIDAALLEQVTMEEFGTDLRREEMERLGELMVDDGLLKEDADVAGLYGD